MKAAAPQGGHSATARRQLNEIRVLLGARSKGRACMWCGAPSHVVARQNLVQPPRCPVCGGTPVGAANLVRAIAEVCRPGTSVTGHLEHEEPMTREPGSVATCEMVTQRVRRMGHGSGPVSEGE